MSQLIYVDLEGAYDKVWHKGLLYKLAQKGLPSNCYNWITQYLHNRTCQVRIGNVLSSEVTFRAGVPQGAIISPILFNIMVSDLPKQQDIEIISYADDITLVTTSTNINTAKKNMQAYLNTLVNYFNSWGMQLNPGKSKMQVFHKRRTKIDYSLRIGGIILPSRATKRLLGIEIDAPKLN